MPERSEFLAIGTAFERVTGMRPSPTTAWRWCTSGSRGVILKTWKYGGRTVTTEPAVEQFIEDRTRATAANKSTSSIRQKLDLELSLKSKSKRID